MIVQPGWPASINSAVHHVTLDREDRSINLQQAYTNDQLLLKLFNHERCIHLPVCTEITRIIVLDWIIDIFIHHKMIVEKKIQSKNKEKQLNTIKRIYKKHYHINDISQEISYDVFREQCTEVQTETLYDSN